jgi:hypothetical protein
MSLGATTEYDRSGQSSNPSRLAQPAGRTRRPLGRTQHCCTPQPKHITKMHFVKRDALANLNTQRNTRGRNLTKEAGGGHQATASPKSYASSAAPDYSQSELPRSTPHYQESFDRAKQRHQVPRRLLVSHNSARTHQKPPCCQVS